MKTREVNMLTQILKDKKAIVITIMRTCKSTDKLKNRMITRKQTIRHISISVNQI